MMNSNVPSAWNPAPSDSVGWRRPSFARDVSKTICHTHDSESRINLLALSVLAYELAYAFKNSIE